MNQVSASLDSAQDELPEIADHVLLRRIGRGAYGEVWLARNMTGAFRAVKVIHRQTFSDERPFQREFEGICRFEPVSRSHPGLVTVLHVGQNPQAGNFYYVMELADDTRTGQIIDVNSYVPRTLKEELANHRRLPLHKKLETALSLASALEYLHAANLVHRDIKPANIIFVNGLAKFADVGLMVEVGGDMVGLGTKYFMPPEGPGAPTGDIYSLGKVFYELFMGLPAKDFPELPDRGEEFSTNRALLKLNNIVLKACQTDPKQRSQTADELHDALLSVTEMVHDTRPGTPSKAPGDRVDAAEATPVSHGQSAAAGEPSPKLGWSRRSALLVALPATIGGAFLLMNRNRGVSGTQTGAVGPPQGAAAAPGAPVLVLMDTTADHGIYDEQDKGKGITNAEVLQRQLQNLPLGRIYSVPISGESYLRMWRGESRVLEMQPALVLIHRSAFFHPANFELGFGYRNEPGYDEKRWKALYAVMDDKLVCFIGYVGTSAPRTKFLIYSRGTDPNWLKPEFREEWVGTIESRFPALKGRVSPMLIPSDRATFRDPVTAEEMRQRVKQILNLSN